MKNLDEIITRIEELKVENEEMIEFAKKYPNSGLAREYYSKIVINANIISGLNWVLNIKERE